MADSCRNEVVVTPVPEVPLLNIATHKNVIIRPDIAGYAVDVEKPVHFTAVRAFVLRIEATYGVDEATSVLGRHLGYFMQRFHGGSAGLNYDIPFKQDFPAEVPRDRNRHF